MFKKAKTPNQARKSISSSRSFSKSTKVQQFRLVANQSKKFMVQNGQISPFPRLFSPYITQKGLQSVQTNSKTRSWTTNGQPLKSSRLLFSNEEPKSNKQEMSLPRRKSDIEKNPRRSKKKHGSEIEISYRKNPEYFENLEREKRKKRKQKSWSKLMCFFHGSKKGKWIVVDTSSELHQHHFCSKCAIKLAQDGVQVQSIGSAMKQSGSNEANQDFDLGEQDQATQCLGQDERQNTRGADKATGPDEGRSQEDQRLPKAIKTRKIEEFLIQLKAQRIRTESLKADLGAQLSNTNQQFEAQKHQLNETFEEMQVIVIQKQQEMMHQLKKLHNKTLAEMCQAQKAVDQNVHDMKNINSDINSHKHKIIKKIQLQAFGNIMRQYQERVDQYSQVEQFLATEKIQGPRVEMDGLQNFVYYLDKSFKVAEESISYLPEGSGMMMQGQDSDQTQQGPNQQQLEKSPQQMRSRQGKTRGGKSGPKEEVWISFENKNMFLKAMCQDRMGNDLASNKENIMQQANLQAGQRTKSLHGGPQLMKQSMKYQDHEIEYAHTQEDSFTKSYYKNKNMIDQRLQEMREISNRKKKPAKHKSVGHQSKSRGKSRSKIKTQIKRKLTSHNNGGGKHQRKHHQQGRQCKTPILKAKHFYLQQERGNHKKAKHKKQVSPFMVRQHTQEYYPSHSMNQ